MTSDARDIREICNLSDLELEARQKMLRECLFPLVRKREERPNGLRLYFDESPAMREQLDEFVAYERVCCSSIAWSVGSVSGALRLEIDGIDPRSSLFASIGADLAGSSGPEELELRPRLIRSVGFGSIGALLLCCALPLGTVALVGATPLLLLDDPWVIVGTAIAMSAMLWRWQGWRAKRQTTSRCDC